MTLVHKINQVFINRLPARNRVNPPKENGKSLSNKKSSFMLIFDVSILSFIPYSQDIPRNLPMNIKSTAPAKHLSKNTVKVQTKDTTNVSVHLNLKNAVPQAPKSQDNNKEGHISPLLTKGTSLGIAYKASSYVLDGVKDANVLQVSKLLQDYHLVETTSHAEKEAQRLLDIAQSKGSSALLLGAHAGMLTVVAIDLLKPEWSFSHKLTIGLIVMIIVAALSYFGIQEEPKPETEASQISPH